MAHFSLSILITIFSLFSTLNSTNAAPTTTSSPDHICTSAPFKLLSRSLSAPYHFTNYYVTTYHIGAAINYAVLYPSGITGELNGTKSELTQWKGDLIFPINGGFGAGGFDYTWIITDEQYPKGNATGSGSGRAVQISAEEGTKGMFVDQDVLKYFNPLSGGWFACNTTLLYGSAIQVFWKIKVYPTPAGCEDVELVAKHV